MHLGYTVQVFEPKLTLLDFRLVHIFLSVEAEKINAINSRRAELLQEQKAMCPCASFKPHLP